MDFNAPIYTTGRVARAAQLSQRTLKTWLDRDVIARLLGSVAAGTGTGNFRRFSARDAIHLAIMARLVQIGFAPANASAIVSKFSQEGDGDSGWVHSAPLDGGRAPGELFERGPTLLQITFASEGAMDAEVLGFDSLESLNSRIAYKSDAAEVTHMLINIAPIVRRVKTLLATSADEAEEAENEGGWIRR